jgi:hypothetical protein
MVNPPCALSIRQPLADLRNLLCGQYGFVQAALISAISHVVELGTEEQVSKTGEFPSFNHVDPRFVVSYTGAVVARVKDLNPFGNRLARRQFPCDAVSCNALSAGSCAAPNPEFTGSAPVNKPCPGPTVIGLSDESTESRFERFPRPASSQSFAGQTTEYAASVFHPMHWSEECEPALGTYSGDVARAERCITASATAILGAANSHAVRVRCEFFTAMQTRTIDAHVDLLRRWAIPPVVPATRGISYDRILPCHM